MVFFVCEGCNETLKKNQVDRHASICRCCHSVTCVDCQITFKGDDYTSHVKCISEAEKYEKTLFKGKKVKRNVQEQWLVVIEEASKRSDTATPNIRSFLKRLVDLSNVPRNKSKFVNFIKNSLKIQSTSFIEDIWSFLETVKNELDKLDLSVSEASTVAVQIIEDLEQASDEIQQVQAENESFDRPKKTKKKKRVANELVGDEQACDEIQQGQTENESFDRPKKTKKKKRVVNELVGDEQACDEIQQGQAENESFDRPKKAKKKKRVVNELVGDEQASDGVYR